MLNSVLFILNVIVATITIMRLDRSIKLVSHLSAVRKILLNDMMCYAIMMTIMIALWLGSGYIEGKAFGIVLFVAFNLISAVVAEHSRSYARQHLPALRRR